MLRLSDQHWERIRHHFPEENIPASRPGRKPIPTREVLEAALWILNTGAQWHMLPQCYPNYKTVHRRFQNWCDSEVLRNVLTDLANTLRDEGAISAAEFHVLLGAAVRDMTWKRTCEVLGYDYPKIKKRLQRSRALLRRRLRRWC